MTSPSDLPSSPAEAALAGVAGGSLLVDLGGTNCRMALARDGEVEAAGLEIAANDAYPSLEAALGSYIDAHRLKPARAVIAIGGPVTGDRVKLTNRAWSFSARELARRFGLEAVRIINDFEALALALPHLDEADVAPIGAPLPVKGLAKAVLGPGTGLGVSGLIPTDAGMIAVPSEGGHVELAATTPEEVAVLDVVRAEFGRVGAEHILSGPGLARLHAARTKVAGLADERLGAPQVADRAAAGEAEALASIGLFFDFLARFAGDVALAFAARGGCYLHGGVAVKLAAHVDHARFRSIFENKHPHRPLMASIATVRVTAEVPALLGCAEVARRIGKAA